MKKVLAAGIALGFFFTATRGEAGILSPSSGQSCSPLTWAQYSWPYDMRMKYWREWLSLGAASEAAQIAYSAEWALWELKKPAIPRAYAAYNSVTYWGLLPFRLKTAGEPASGTGLFVRGRADQDALAFVREHRVALGVPTAPEHVKLYKPVIQIQDCYIGNLEPPPYFSWEFEQNPSLPKGVSCKGCSASITVNRRTLQVVQIKTGLVDLPHELLPPPLTTAEEALARFREMRPGARLPHVNEVYLSYAQDASGKVELFWEIAVLKWCGEVSGLGGNEHSRQWVALDARNLAIRGYDTWAEDR